VKLKKIRSFGFKTFAEPTALEFGDGVTAIVGPNGSGKSNLVDAFRWVLGETSTKSIRSGRLEDVIFAGNESRKPLGLAEVSILFDNSDGALPIDFNEVEITRRAYRVGESEYFINRSQVRLRDVLDLVMGTGLDPARMPSFRKDRSMQSSSASRPRGVRSSKRPRASASSWRANTSRCAVWNAPSRTLFALAILLRSWNGEFRSWRVNFAGRSATAASARVCATWKSSVTCEPARRAAQKGSRYVTSWSEARSSARRPPQRLRR